MEASLCHASIHRHHKKKKNDKKRRFLRASRAKKKMKKKKRKKQKRLVTWMNEPNPHDIKDIEIEIDMFVDR